MIDILGIVFIGIEIFFILYLLIKSISDNEIINDKTMKYIIPLFILSLLIHLVGVIYSTDKFTIYNVFLAIHASVESFGFQLSEDLTSKAVNDSVYFEIAYCASSIMNGITLVSALFGLFKVNIKNKFRVFVRKHKGRDIVIGYNKNAIEYAKLNNAILWVDTNLYKLTHNEKAELFEQNVAYIYAPIIAKKICSYLITVFRDSHFICFMNESRETVIPYIDVFKQIKKHVKKRFTINLHIEVKNEQLDFVNDQISKIIKDTLENVLIYCFSLSELLSRKYIMENNFLDHLPENFIKDGALLKDINVFYLGFGSTNRAILKSNTLNNHFVKREDGKLKAYPVNNYLFDINGEKFNCEYVTRLKMNYYKDNINHLPIEKICNIYNEEINVQSIEFINEISKIINDDNYNIFFVSFSNSGKNVTYSETLDNYFETKNIHIYYNVESQMEIISNNISPRITPYGFDNELLYHDVIVNDSLSKMAKLINNNYKELKVDDDNRWHNLPTIEKFSNIYNSINIKFKLELIDFKYKDLDFFLTDLENFKKKLYNGKTDQEIEELKKYDNYYEYFKTDLRNVIGYLEHMRWNTYYYLHNYNPLAFSKIKLNENNKLVLKELEAKKHACLTSYYGLDELHNFLVKKYKENNINKSLQDVEVYKYDYMICDNLYDSIKKINYIMNKK